eukprot:916822-Amphidinium_carterae.1
MSFGLCFPGFRAVAIPEQHVEYGSLVVWSGLSLKDVLNTGNKHYKTGHVRTECQKQVLGTVSYTHLRAHETEADL